jgi:hypothetical protein
VLDWTGSNFGFDSTELELESGPLGTSYLHLQLAIFDIFELGFRGWGYSKYSHHPHMHIQIQTNRNLRHV